MAAVEAEPGDLRGELADAKAALARVEAERDQRVAAALQQLQDAKERAKCMFLARVNKFEAQIADLEEAARARAAENDRLKSLVRDADVRACDAGEKLARSEELLRAAVDDAVATVAKERDEARAKLVDRGAELVRAQRRADDAEEERRERSVVHGDERKRVLQRVVELEDRLRRAESSAASASATALDGAPVDRQNGQQPDGSGSPPSSGEGGPPMPKSAGTGRAVDGEAHVAALQSSLVAANARIADLEGDAEQQAAAATAAAEEERGVASELQASLDAAKAQITALEADVRAQAAERTSAVRAVEQERVALAAAEAASATDAADAEREAAAELRTELAAAAARAANLEAVAQTLRAKLASEAEALERERSTSAELETAAAAAKVRVSELEAVAERRGAGSGAAASNVASAGTADVALLQTGRDTAKVRIEPAESAVGGRAMETPAAPGPPVPPDAEPGTKRGAAHAPAADLRTHEAEGLRGLEDSRLRVAEMERANGELEGALTAAKVALADSQAALAAAKEEAAVAVRRLSAWTAAPDAEATAQRAPASTSSAAAGDDGRATILEAKVSELERLFAAKQVEMVKVREKARAYLKDLSAEKREMESKLRAELAALASRVEGERAKVVEAEHETERTSRELDSCLGVIAEKQKAAQALNMTISNERAATKEAQTQTTKLNAEFDRYRERARVALAERDAAVASASMGIEQATEELRSRLDAAVAEATEVRHALKAAEDEADRATVLEGRAAKAEAALALIKTDASVISSANVARIDALQEEMDALRTELAASESAAANAEARLSTAVVRLEVSERALKAVETGAAEAARTADSRIERLLARIAALEGSLGQANESAAAAQRTAAVAARAMAYASLDDGAVPSPSSAGVRESPSLHSVSSIPPAVGPAEPFSPGFTADGGRREGGSVLGGAGSLRDFLPGGAVAQEVSARDDQIAVLMSQISELGVLLADAQEGSSCREQQVSLLKSEVRDLDAKLAAADKLQGGAPFGLLRTTVVHYMRTGDPALLPVLATVLGVSEGEMVKVRATRTGAVSTDRDPDSAGYLPAFMRPSR
jgi:trimeric autotransporter adhesin